MGKRILDWWIPQLDENHISEISWWGGEPLLEYKLIQKLLYYAQGLGKKHGKNIIHGGTTNGILYTPDKVEWLVQNNSAMMVSLDGIKPAHDCSRVFPNGKGSWEIVDKNLREAIKVWPNQRVRSSLSTRNVEYFFETVQYLFEDIGLKHIAFSPVYEDDWTEEKLEVCREQFDLVGRYMVKRLKEGHECTIKHFNDGVNMTGRYNFQMPCGAGRFYAGWSVDGFLFPCHRFNKHGLTSAEREKLPTILAKPKGDSFEYVNGDWRKTFIEPELGGTWNPKKCEGCKIYCRSTCAGSCYATNYDLSGKIDDPGPEKVCELQKLHVYASKLIQKLAQKEGIRIGMADGNKRDKPEKSCICFGGCYSEAYKPIMHTNDSDLSDMACGCYNATYNGGGIFRTFKQINEDNRKVIQALETVAKNAPELQKEIIDQCVKILKKEHVR
jgi:uncharacterized protein